jgi:copper resistance protein C
VVGAVLTLVVGAHPAAAHNSLVASSPAAGQTVAQVPAAVVLTFDEPAIAMGTQIVITGPSGPAQAGAPRLVDNTVAQDIQAGAPAGDYTVTWRVTSVDGHPISGTFTFTATDSSAGTPAAPGSPSDAPPVPPTADFSAATWIAAGIALGGLILGGALLLARRRR